MKNTTVIEHYSSGSLLGAISTGLAGLGKTSDTVTLDDLAPVEEFHIGGRQATGNLVDQIDLGAQDHVLDIGCGIGGTARFIADRYGARADGIDLTPEFVATGTEINKWLGLDDLVTLRVANALDTECSDQSFDAATMLHVRMNIADKPALFRQVHRVLRPGGRFALYDIMANNNAARDYPVPWATGPDGCSVAPVQVYLDGLQAAGFEIIATRDRTEYAEAFIARIAAGIQASSGPPPIGLHLVLGNDAPVKVANMMTNFATGRVSPVEIIARKI